MLSGTFKAGDIVVWDDEGTKFLCCVVGWGEEFVEIRAWQDHKLAGRMRWFSEPLGILSSRDYDYLALESELERVCSYDELPW